MFVISGVTGHVGAVAANELIAKGQKIKVIVRDAAKGAAWSQKGAEVAVGTVEDQAFLTNALKGAAGFFALLPPNMVPQDIFGWQKTTSDAIAGAVKASGVPHVVLLSSVGADVTEGSGPIKGLHYLEEALKKTGTRLTAIRAGSFMENIHNSLTPAKNMGIFPNFMPSADAAMPMIATKDIGMLAAKSLIEKPAKSETVDLVGPAYSQRQVAEKLGKLVGKTLQIMDIPEAGWIGAMEQGGMPPHVAKLYAEMYHGFVSGKLTPKGDRMVQGTTTLDEVIKTFA